MLRAMPNWSYILINALYHLGLALWIGGAIALGALAAPVLFRSLPRQQAGSIFGPTLRRFARLRVLALLLIVVGAGCKFLFYESHAATVWLALRWAAIAFLALALVYELGYQERAMERARGDEVVFGRLHRRAEALLRASVLAALLALVLS
jgi:putative copper export protein